MRYTGFDTRKFLILDNIDIKKNKSYLEVGVGIGDILDIINEKVGEYYGVDISGQAIEYLRKIYNNSNFLYFICLDVCADFNGLNKKFDFIFSADTLEHVESADKFFLFIKNHLNPNGKVVITFPNESSENHHGILWFDNKSILLNSINNAGLKADSLLEVRLSLWHKFIKFFFWIFPKSLFAKKNKLPQIFEETDAFNLIKENNLKTKILALYLRIIVSLAKIFKLYNYFEVGNDVKNKNLIIKISYDK